MDRRSQSNPDQPQPDAIDAMDAALETQAAARPHESGSGDSLEPLRQKAAERDEYLGLLQRVRADYANYQKRAQKELETTRRYATQPLLSELLPVIDNLERAMQSAEGTASPLLDGIRLVHQQLLGALARHGVRPIEAQGQPFNPDVHEAMLERPSDQVPERTVLDELQKGYMLHDRVLRPTRVVVSAAGATPTPDKESA